MVRQQLLTVLLIFQLFARKVKQLLLLKIIQTGVLMLNLLLFPQHQHFHPFWLPVALILP